MVMAGSGFVSRWSGCRNPGWSADLTGAVIFRAENRTGLLDGCRHPRSSPHALHRDQRYRRLPVPRRRSVGGADPDVRTPEEWTQIGVPTLESIGKRVRFATWTWFGTGERNPNSWPRRPRARAGPPAVSVPQRRPFPRGGDGSRGGRLRHHLQRGAGLVVPAQPAKCGPSLDARLT